MEWCENNGIDYVFGFGGGNAVLDEMVREAADALCVERALTGKEKLRRYKKLRYGAKSWGCQRTLVARLEASSKGLDIRYIVTSLKGSAKHLYETLYCARGEAENFIKLHKGTTRIRSHLLPRSQGQSVPPDPTHRRLLAPTQRAQGGAKGLAPIPRRVRDPQTAPHQDGRSCRGRRCAHSRITAERLSRRCTLSPACRILRSRRSVNRAAVSPQPSHVVENPQHTNQFSRLVSSSIGASDLTRPARKICVALAK